MERNIKLLSWLNFFTDFVFFAPVAIIYFAKVTGSYAAGMSIFSIAYASSALFEIPTGMISDLVGRKLTTIFGTICSAACVIVYAIGGSYWMLIAGALIQGLSGSFFSGNNDALLHDSLKALNKEHEYHIHFGRTSSMFQIGLAFASIAGSIMASISFSVVMWLSVIPQILAFIISLFITEPSVSTNKYVKPVDHMKYSLKEFSNNRKLRLLTMASMFRFALGESGYFLRSAFINSIWPLWAVGFSNFLSNIGGAFSYYFSGKIINKYSHKTVLWFEILFNRFLNLTALLFPTVISPVLMGFTSVAYGAGSVSLNSLQQKEFTQNQRATMGSMTSLMGYLLFGVISVLLGKMADVIGPLKSLIVLHVLLFIPLLFYREIFKKKI